MNIKTIKYGLFFSIAFISLASCTSVIEHKTSLVKGENLITPYSGFLAGWQLSVENNKNYHSRMWQHPIHGFKDAYVISVISSEDKNNSYFRQVLDKPGYESCLTFTSFTLQSSPDIQYPSELWQTTCQKTNGGEAKILHLILQGKNSLYHVQKIWQNKVNASDISLWLNRFNQIYLCDNSAISAACPSN